ncbi:tellurite resistance TerB family protein [Leisingera caerulea]|uniref:TerB family tellurite resistance protein n=1 Tax=Leisingera caerulea TaxID=506591 RepID=A0A9Q9HJF2_LEICA|nr:TerB family tellurite resistance protein [Leisingera caerulea]UWQ51654.1 TerB family tellurite resistance protein [Leisingera caerulea]UWQ55803.1 TerB family tellurite resistance protein [Leisingera caerulea]UWQ64525.1 TerB family tellurite resistance protein [Leisingera caerulea]UWQ85447.1 TerB family tellurite resistance protein [Leisingera caerulea]
MLKKFFQAFRPSEPPALPDPDAELALGALLVRVAQSDRDYQLEEISLIDRILARLYQHNAIEAAKVRATCEKLHAAAPETDTFGRLIRETTGLEERLAALDALWEVVLADGSAHEGEVTIVEDARKAMGLSYADSQKARERAEEKLGSTAGEH